MAFAIRIAIRHTPHAKDMELYDFQLVKFWTQTSLCKVELHGSPTVAYYSFQEEYSIEDDIN